MLRDQKEMVRFLIDKGAEYSAIHVAAYFGDLEQVKGYLADGGDINAKSPSELTLLSSAIFGDQANMVEFLISKGANVNLRGGFGCTALHWASVISSRENIARLLLAKDSDVELRDKTGRIALHWAALKGYKAVVEMLLAKGADVNAKSGTIITEGEEDSGWSPLHEACAGGQKDVVEILIANGADISAKTEKGDTALSVAKKEYELKGKSEHKDIIELLRTHGAKE
jgi:cytohesin